jgi:hypothetical protein
MKISFLFWNIGNGQKPQLLQSICRLAGLGVQVFLFAEPPADASVLLDVLNRAATGARFDQVASRSKRVLYLSSIQDSTWTDRFFDSINDRVTALELQPADATGILLIGAHLLSPVNQSSSSRADWARDVASDIRRIEGDAGHQRTVLVGDLNMNPFDEGLIATTALHAVMTRKLAISVQGLGAREGFLPFYNPMWSCLGDRIPGPADLGQKGRPPGTHFYNNTLDRTTHFWQMYDQVLLRPALMDKLRHLEILDSDGQIDLVTAEGRPRSDALADHLPVLFELEL